MPKISVVVPVYGVEKYIERCARSLFEQTLDDIEYLFIDDCSPDRSVLVLNKVLEEYPQRKDQVIIHRMNKNSGQAAVRKWGMQNATGEYVIHCDSDDWVELDTYEHIYTYAINGNHDIVFFDYFKSDGFNHTVIHRLKESFVDKNDVIRLLLSTRLTGSVCLACFRRSLYEKSNFVFPKENMGEDLAMMLQMVYNSQNTISYISTPFYYYRDNISSISKSLSENSVLRRLKDNVENGNLMINFLEAMGVADNMSSEIDIYKFAVRKNLYPLLGKEGYYKMWRECYPEINNRFLLNTQASRGDKLRFLACYLGCYHFLSKVIRLFKD